MRPVSRWRVLVAGLVLAAFVAGVIGLAETLRHPLPTDAAREQLEPDADPASEVICVGPEPREGQERIDRDALTAAFDEVTSNELYDCPQTWDGRRVRYRGEVVGAVLRRDDGAWVQLNDDVYSQALGPLPAHRDFRGGNAGVGVLLPHDVADGITVVGGPGWRGDVLEVVGTFERVERETGEVAIIRAAGGVVADAGEPVREAPLADRRVAALVLAGVAAAVVALERLAARRR